LISIKVQSTEMQREGYNEIYNVLYEL